ncbi:hypothetical protein QRX50_36390 [Amycolatopsis carbonis]|uniref:Uncharacterized protein n=1 Tax=Amycolatopsis carbonis TaxID=715471 RepID=A0A9Y2IB66_9PSEU|nr:hypothetical protein [Amycolatopsis sp. 2-15]WIX76867.1 hypothetical protein QRX50_36390 [Amycolatopsis sp. 2-15]
MTTSKWMSANRSHDVRLKLAAVVAGFSAVATIVSGCSSSSPSNGASASTTMSMDAMAHNANTDAEVKLYTGQRNLWSQHMEWTYSTVNAFFHDQNALQPTVNRLLQNQPDIGAAFAVYYGADKGKQLTDLLTTHINDAVPVLKAAQAGDNAGLQSAMKAWYDNAKQIADYTSSLNPKSWPLADSETMWRQHIDQTAAYAVDLLKNDFTGAIRDYGKAEEHMASMADMYSKGIVTQFPNRFTS